VKDVALVAAGGALGAVARYLVQLALAARGAAGFPLATFVANVSGCLLLGALLALGELRGTLAPSTRLFLATGFLGAFTTFSTYAVEGEALLQRGLHGRALVYLCSSVVGGVAAAWIGRAAVQLLAARG